MGVGKRGVVGISSIVPFLLVDYNSSAMGIKLTKQAIAPNSDTGLSPLLSSHRPRPSLSPHGAKSFDVPTDAHSLVVDSSSLSRR